MSANKKLIEDFCAAWSRLDPAELAAYFTEDGVYYNMPAAPVQGRAAIEQFIRGFTASWTQLLGPERQRSFVSLHATPTPRSWTESVV